MEKKESEAIKGVKLIDGIEVKTLSKEIVSCNIITVEVGTTGYMGGDTGHGGRTYFRISDEASTDMRCNVVSEGEIHQFDNTCGANQIEVMFGGDCEMETFIEALEFAAETLRNQSFGQPAQELTPKEKKQRDFKSYLEDLIKLYAETKKLKGMGEIQKQHHVSNITQADFFECGLNEAARDGVLTLDLSFTNAIYDYILSKDTNATAPRYTKK